MQRLFRVTDAALRQALPLAGLAAVYVAVETVSALHRGEQRLLLDGLYGGVAVAALGAGARLCMRAALCLYTLLGQQCVLLPWTQITLPFGLFEVS
jgi:hypothetical protein